MTMSTVKYSWQYRTLYLKVIDLNRKPNLITRIWQHLPVYQAQTHNQMTNHHSFFFQTILSIFINKLHFDIKHLPPPPPPFCVCVWFLFVCLFFLFLFFFCHCLSYLCVLLYDILLLHELSTFFFFFFLFFPFPIVVFRFPISCPLYDSYFSSLETLV